MQYTWMTRIGARALALPDPCSPSLGVARSILALGTAGTIALTDPRVLFAPVLIGSGPAVPGPHCTGLSRWALYCTTSDSTMARLLAVVILLIVASGWRPRFTAIPHVWVVWSLMQTASLSDGGDQISVVLAVLLVPICLSDARRWHWSRSPTAQPGLGLTVRAVTLYVIRAQMAFVYFNAFAAKLGVKQWANGTAFYYTVHDPLIGATGWTRPILDVIIGAPVGLAVLTWGTLALEAALAFAWLLPASSRRPLLIAGIGFHAGIALVLGLVSFGFAMTAGLVLYLAVPVLPTRFRALGDFGEFSGKTDPSRSTSSQEELVV